MKMELRQLVILALFTLVAFMVTAPAHAEALLVPIVDGRAAHVHPIQPLPGPRPLPSALPFRMTNSKVDVRIEENIATTTLEQSFLNLTGRDLEVRVMIPLPAGAAIDSSALSMNDQMIEGKLYDAQQAQTIYESIVSQRKDPALLRFVGDNMYEARVFPIAPNQERKLKFRYTQVVNSAAGMYDYKHILAGSQLYQNGIENFSFECTIKSKDSLGPVYSPSHQVAVQRPDDKTAIIKLNGTNLSSDRNFHLYFTPSNGDVAMRLITHRASENEDGYFMLIGRADDQIEKGKILPKEVVFVFDTSGSMQGEKIEQAKKALKFCLNSLTPQDRFNLITFATDIQGLSSDKLLDATKENIQKALAAVDQIEATGGTNIDGALTAAMGSDFTEGATKAKSIVFMTDGLPTVGVVDPQSIFKGVQTANTKHKARIFNFGVGNDVNTHLLDKMSADFDGVSTYVSPREDIEVKVSDMYSKVKHPVMTNVQLDFGSESRVSSVYPRRIPALYRGGEVMVLGRFKGAAPAEIVLTGQIGGETRRIPLKVTWPARDLNNSYLPRVWAMRKIGHLLEEVRLYGQNQEMIQEIVALAQRHGIVTPYTSQLVLEPGMENFDGRWRRNGAPIEERAGIAPPAAKPGAALADHFETVKKAEAAARPVALTAQNAVSGETAVALADFDRNLKDARPGDDGFAIGEAKGRAEQEKRKESLYKLGTALRADKAQGGGRGADALAEQIERAQQDLVKQVGTRTFYNRMGVWIDSTIKADAKKVSIKAYSKEYFELLKQHNDLGPVLALGGSIMVAVGEQVYEVTE